MKLRFPLLYLSALLVLALALAGCGGSNGSEAEASDADSAAADSTGAAARPENGDDGEEEDDPIPVDVAVLERGSIEAVLRASANIEAESEVMVRAEAARRVTELLVEEGDPVRKGQVLLRLQDEEQRNALAKAQSQLDKNQREYERQQALADQELSSDQALLDAKYAFDQASIALEAAERDLGYATVRAPISGTVTRRLVNLADQVQIGQELFEIIDFESLVARIYIPEKNLREIATGQTARVTARAVSEKPFPASVIRIAPVVDPRTGTVKVTVGVGDQPGLRPGLFADVELVTRTLDQALLVPKRALVYDNDQTFVFRIGDERRVDRLLVEPVLADRDFVVPGDGLAAGDSIVIAGQTGLKTGVKVRLVGEEPPKKQDEDDAKTASAESR